MLADAADEMLTIIEQEFERVRSTAPLQHDQPPLRAPETGRVAVNVINHYGDEVPEVYEV